VDLLQLAPADVLALDEHLLALNKPRGWPTQGRASLGGDSVYAAALRYLGVDRLWPVHWLDRVTSGVLVLARSSASAAALSAQFERRTTRKTYLAWVHGAPSPVSGRIDLPLTREGGRPRVDHEIGKPASTRYRVLRTVTASAEATGAASLLYLRPLTGRTHQLRVHLAAIGHPILGDPIHGRRNVGDDSSGAGAFGSDSMAGASEVAAPEVACLLHAIELHLRHPADGRPLRLRAPVRDGFSLDRP
jgi:RluA family pseudouridine synthase